MSLPIGVSAHIEFGAAGSVLPPTTDGPSGRRPEVPVKLPGRGCRIFQSRGSTEEIALDTMKDIPGSNLTATWRIKRFY